MKVKEVIKMLETCDQEALVVIQKDSEGNSYSPISGAWQGYYEAYSTYSGDAYDKNEDGREKAVFLAPIN